MDVTASLFLADGRECKVITGTGDYSRFCVIERLHQTLQLGLLNVRGPFASIEDAQAAVGAWREGYNTMRPHKSLRMAFPAARFGAAAGDAIGLRIPAELTCSRLPSSLTLVPSLTAGRPPGPRSIPAATGKAGPWN